MGKNALRNLKIVLKLWEIMPQSTKEQSEEKHRNFFLCE